ncbi:SAM-dependent methyltransferase [Nocardiopsis gilva YIM 90087]|uniref:SAM-dependent methyltransferase n=2 Tax=Nocardiopsis gilva TaxID=280236 RepID=A0A223S525_9ACTN|nr:SAM-dependent methyltransferase [Nocardiopsis gilva YIM 90087]
MVSGMERRDTERPDSRHRQLWTGEPPGANPFALPRGLVGRLAGWVLAWANRGAQAEIMDILDVPEGAHVLEVGHGPGVLIEMLAARPNVTVTGVDPSAEMVRMAQRRNAAAVRDGRVRIRLGGADSTCMDDESVDLVVSVNTVAMWPRLDDGVAEFHRVLRPGGRTVITWHRVPARFRLTAEEFAAIESAVRDRFGAVERTELPSSVVFSATR